MFPEIRRKTPEQRGTYLGARSLPKCAGFFRQPNLNFTLRQSLMGREPLDIMQLPQQSVGR